MENEKRKVGDYTVLCAVNIGSREIILAENEQSANGERFLCCYGERNDIFEKFSECAVGDDYIDAALFFAERIKKDAEQFRAEVEKLDIPVTVITQVDCIPDHYKNDINGKIIAINPAVLKPEYQRADRQLYYVTGGFGASANARGSAVFCKNLYDGKNTRFERMDVLGEIKPERMPDWAKEKAAAFSRTIQGKDHERYEWMEETNYDYLSDERVNLNVQLSQPIIVIGDIGRWNGRVMGYKDIPSGNIRDCLYADTDYTEWYVDKYGDLRADATHHDGTNHYLYRVFKDGVSETQMENLRDKIYHGKATRADITRLTRRLGDEIAAVYGFDIPKQRVSQERSER